uniref:(northern house mosquito) hypothetical protein n=1 Tax=Culex pipiens TaxID=7175 RepID=A0A8D8J470_CULPI
MAKTLASGTGSKCCFLFFGGTTISTGLAFVFLANAGGVFSGFDVFGLAILIFNGLTDFLPGVANCFGLLAGCVGENDFIAAFVCVLATFFLYLLSRVCGIGVRQMTNSRVKRLDSLAALWPRLDGE